MVKKWGGKILSILLCVTILAGLLPAQAYAGYEDGTECEYCGGYRFDDWLCDCGPHCSENSDSVDCYLAHHCANCLQSCDEDEKCDECEFCSECWGETGQHCSLCGKHDDDTCENCYSCSDCQESEGFHCYYCGGCLGDLPLCDQHEPEVGQENHCGDCALKCNDCGECYSGEYDEIFCEDCNMCFQCAEINGYHCNLLYCCVPGERCEECEYCVECGIDEGLHCPECEKHVDEWCERGGEGTHCMECAENFRCEQCGECTECAETEFCEDCGVCEDCCRDNAADEGCSCGEYCVSSGDWEEHFCPDCETCFDENEACEICGYCIECCANQSDCSEGLCIEDTDYDDHFCEQCNECFHNVEVCESCQDAGTILCEECCKAVTEEHGCEHEYCVNSWQWEEHFCPVCQKCYDECDHDPEVHKHVYDTNGNCQICGMNKDGKPVIYKQPKSVVADPDESYVKFTVEAFGNNLKYQWYSWNQAQGDFVALTDSKFFISGSQSKTLRVSGISDLCKIDKPIRLICKVENKSATAVSEIAELSVAHKFGGYTYDSTYHWKKCKNCAKTENRAEHSFGAWKITKTATSEAEGLKERVCFDCGHVNSESIPKLEKKHVHDYSAAYIKSDDYHWGQCVCGLENKGASEKHNYGEWVTTTQPTAATPGEQTRACETCGYEETKKITPQGHTHEFYNKEYIENHRDNGNYGSLVYDGHLVSLYEAPYGKTDKTFHYAYCVVDGCDAYEKYSHQWYTEWYEAPTSVSDGSYEIRCKDCHYLKKTVTTPAGKYRIVTIGGSANLQTAKPGQKVKLTPYSKYPVGQYFDPDHSDINVSYTWGGGASGTWGSDVDVEYHAPDSEDTREYWYFTMPNIPADKLSGDIETDYWNVYVEVEFEIYDCCSDEETADDRFYEWVGKVDANCGQPGYTGDYVCTLCNYVKIRGEVIPVTGEPHGELIEEPSFEGSCTEFGYIGKKTCSVCNQLVEPRVSTGKKHTPVPDYSTYVEPTCTSKGRTIQYVCDDCGIVLTKSKSIAKLSHTWEEIEGISETCTTKGTLAHFKCTVCNKVSLDKNTELINETKLMIPSLGGHKWDTASNGSKVCHVCGETSGEVPDGLWCTEIKPQQYNGKALKPTVYVYHRDKLLTVGKDYTVSYQNNTNAAAYDAVNSKNKSIAPTVVIKGKGNFSGTLYKTFTINPINLSTYKTNTDLQKVLTIGSVYVKQNGKFIKGVPSFKLNGKSIAVKAKQYTLQYNDVEEGAYINPGEWNITISGSGKNFIGNTTVTQTISPKLISGVTISLDKSSYPYNDETGKTYPGKVTVKDGKKLLTEGTDYTVSYSDYQKIGTAKVTITGINNYSGSKSKSYKITGIALNSKMVKQLSNFTYNEKQHTVKAGINYTITYKGAMLKEGTDYVITYSGNQTNAGKFKVTFKGINQYSGSVSKTYTISKVSAANLSVQLQNPENIIYSKNGAKPKLNVYFGKTLLSEGKDYKITYVNNNKVAAKDAKNAPYLYITGIGNFTGNTKKTPLKFTILGAVLSEYVTMTANDVVYKNEKNNYVPSITLIDKVNGKKLVSKTDYSGSRTYEIWDKEAGSYVPFTGKKVTISGERIKMCVTVTGIKNYSGTLSAEYEICPKNISTVSVSKIPTQVYTGRAIEPIPTVKFKVKEGSKYVYKVLEPENYNVEYKNNVNKGTATIYIHGKGEYGGTKKVTFKITSQKMQWWYNLFAK